MNDLNAFWLIHGIAALVFLVLLGIVLKQRGIGDAVSQIIAGYLVVSMLLALSRLGVQGNLLSFIQDFFILHLTFYGVFLLSLLLLHLSNLFIRRETENWLWWLVGMVWFAAILILDVNWFYFPEILYRSGGWVILRKTLVEVLFVLGWGVFIISTLWQTIKSYRQEELVLMKSRIAYWSLGLFLAVGGHLLDFSGRLELGDVLNLLGAIVITLIVVTPRLPDLKDALRRVLSTLIVAIIELTIYTAGFVGIQYLLRDAAANKQLIVGMVMAVVLLLLFNPLLRTIQNSINRSVFGESKDYSRVLREYSKSISNILDLKLLSTVVVGLISELVGVQRGVLFTVEKELAETGEHRYRLKGFKGMGDEEPIQGVLAINSPIAKTFSVDASPLTRSEIDILPKFRSISLQERNWVNHQKVEIFVPIHVKEEWVGLLALGPKESGTIFDEADLELMLTFADQTAVSLQNARLVESLVRINKEFRRAYSSMEEANIKLEKLDRTKSDFISISSHELRTPLTVLSGYSQMLLEDPKLVENPYYKKIISGINEGTTRLHEIVDSMLEIAKIDTRVLELQSEDVDLSLIIQQVVTSFAQAVHDRQLRLIKDLMDDIPHIKGDPEALKKVFQHLISNAIKYTPDGGKIEISGFLLEKGNPIFPPGGVEVVVSDTGIGIDPRFKDLIFTKFYQTGELALHSSGKTKFKGGGPGLGLAIVRGIIEAHGGRVWAESPGYDEEKRPGSQFHVILPVQAKE
jgi:signal transduction histidine kinase